MRQASMRVVTAPAFTRASLCILCTPHDSWLAHTEASATSPPLPSCRVMRLRCPDLASASNLSKNLQAACPSCVPGSKATRCPAGSSSWRQNSAEWLCSGLQHSLDFARPPHPFSIRPPMPGQKKVACRTRSYNHKCRKTSFAGLYPNREAVTSRLGQAYQGIACRATRQHKEVRAITSIMSACCAVRLVPYASSI